MSTECDTLIRPALNSVFDEQMQIEGSNGDCRVVVPFDRADFDAITLWVSSQADQYVISDRGETYGMLYLSNVDLRQERRQKRLESTKQRFDLEEAEYEIRLSADSETLGERILDAIQAVQSISYLVYTRRSYSQSSFREDVGNYLSEHDIHYSRNAEVEGVTEMHRVDFDVTAARPTYIEAVHAQNVSTAHSMAQRTAHKWTDIGRTTSEVHRVSVLNDESGEYDDRTVRILSEYSDSYIAWSARGGLIDALDSNAGVA